MTFKNHRNYKPADKQGFSCIPNILSSPGGCTKLRSSQVSRYTDNAALRKKWVTVHWAVMLSGKGYFIVDAMFSPRNLLFLYTSQWFCRYNCEFLIWIDRFSSLIFGPNNFWWVHIFILHWYRLCVMVVCINVAGTLAPYFPIFILVSKWLRVFERIHF